MPDDRKKLIKEIEQKSQPELSLDQSEALRRIHEWLDKDHASAPEFRLGGFAGTGKTTLIKRLLDDIQADKRARISKIEEDQHPEHDYPNPEGLSTIGIVSFTGKAVSVLRKKGLSAHTIHSSIYRPVKRANGEVQWERKQSFENDTVFNPQLIIVDEASMLSMSLYKDLQSYQKKLLFVGDPGQLEPIGDNPDLMRNPDYTLTQVHRQALENPILKLSLDVRENKPFLNGVFGDSRELCCRMKDDVDRDVELLQTSDIIICGFNKTRKLLNKRVRELKNHSGLIPQVSDRIIVLQNCPDRDVFNGQIVVVTKLGSHSTLTLDYKRYDVQWVDTEDELGVKRTLPLWTKPLVDSTWDDTKDRCPSSIVLCDFGYAITCHKSQGSEWDNVVVFEPPWWPSKPNFTWDEKRWRYTAITRAAKRLTYARS
jgi:exodeoxyribonuclease-5